MNRVLTVAGPFAILLALAASSSPLAQERAGAASTSASTSAQPPSSPYWQDRWRGWHFYEEPELEVRRPASQPQAAAPATSARPGSSGARPPELEEFARLQKRLEDYRNIAIIRPTEANVRRYMELEAKVVAQASTFADMAQRVAWATPALDPTLQGRPVNAKALEVFDDTQRVDRARTMAQLGKDHVLLFFYRSDCPYCHALAPTLEGFQDRYGMQVVAVSIDGGPMPGFPSARRDNGIARTLQVAQVPAVFLAQPFSGQITPIGFGVLSESQLLERIAVVSSPQGLAMLPSATHQIGQVAMP
ncbi:conjugal transfer protein TraF [Roseateles flavus]|uniref:Conjugal transfer protein TraF n=1 Tax=Roseateles flavus TaxID=3149041 RepID=A0ABV0GKQ1_9BURK